MEKKIENSVQRKQGPLCRLQISLVCRGDGVSGIKGRSAYRVEMKATAQGYDVAYQVPLFW